MKTYAHIKSQIAKLEKQAEAARKAEVAGVVARIKEAIAAYGLTAPDLGFGRGPAARGAVRTTAKKRAAPASKVGVPKYRDPETGRTWTGQGRPPAWMEGVEDRDALLIVRGAKASSGGDGRGGKAKAKRAGTGKRKAGRRSPAAARKTALPLSRTAAVQIESGAASE